MESTLPADLPRLYADPEQMKRVLIELFKNAAAAGGATPRVRVEAQADATESRVVLRVIDRGAGMDAETAQKAFTPFFSAKTAGRRRGMGLSRARRLVHRPGGRSGFRAYPIKAPPSSWRFPGAEDSAVTAQAGVAQE